MCVVHLPKEDVLPDGGVEKPRRLRDVRDLSLHPHLPFLTHHLCWRKHTKGLMGWISRRPINKISRSHPSCSFSYNSDETLFGDLSWVARFGLK